MMEPAVWSLKAGLKEGQSKMKALVIDITKCCNCFACQIACKDEHCGNDWSPYAKPQPETGQFWMKVEEIISGNIPQVRVEYIPQPCMHCKDALCMNACPVEGAIFRRDDGLVIIDPEKCTGCRLCVDACLYNSIYFNRNLNIAQKCTGCAHLLDRGWPIKEPRCVDYCAHEVFSFGEEGDLNGLISQSEVLHPEYETNPRVTYIGLPKRFIAGTVYDPDTKEVAVGATCTLTGEGDTLTLTTDNYGDFWFDGLKENGTYSLDIAATGGKSASFAEISTASDVGLGDIALS